VKIIGKSITDYRHFDYQPSANRLPIIGISITKGLISAFIHAA